MGLLQCDDCGKVISDQSPACVGCGKPIIYAGTGELHLQDIKETDRLKSKPTKLFSWKALAAAALIAIILNILIIAITGGQPRGYIGWTVAWIYLSIEAWKFWHWKALIPYMLFVVVANLLGLTMQVTGIGRMTPEYVFVKMALNIGGLIIFYLLLRKAQKKIMLG